MKTNLHTSLHSGCIYLQNLVVPNGYTFLAHETKTTEPTKDAYKKMSDLRDRKCLK